MASMRSSREPCDRGFQRIFVLTGREGGLMCLGLFHVFFESLAIFFTPVSLLISEKTF